MKQIYNCLLGLYSYAHRGLLSKELKGNHLLFMWVVPLPGIKGARMADHYCKAKDIAYIRADFWKVLLPGIVLMGTTIKAAAQNLSATWGANGNAAWYTAGNWAGGAYAGIKGAAAANSNIATFTNAFTAMTVGINMGTASLNLGAISIDARTRATNIGNSSATGGQLRLYGATVNGIPNIIVLNNGSGLLTLQGNQAGTMEVVLGNTGDNMINTDAAGGVTISGILSGTGSVTKGGSGSGALTLSNAGNTYTGKTIIKAGFINIPGESAFGADPGSFIADQITLDGGGIQVSIGSVIFAGNRGITLTTGGIIDVTNSFIFSLQNAISGSGDLVKSGTGILQLNKAGGNTIPATNNINVNAGTIQISTDQTLNNLSLISGNLTLDDNITLTINGTFDYFQAATITTGIGSSIVYGPGGKLKYSGAIAKVATKIEFPILNGPGSVECNNSGNIILPFNRTITDSLVLTTGTFIIDAGVLLDLNGASLSSNGGYLAGNALNGSASDLTIRGTTGGTVILPTNVTIGLRNITVGDTRTVALNGINHLNLSGALTIAGNAVFYNGGESEVRDGGAPALIISGTFITMDADGFTGSNSSIPGIIPLLNPGCTIEYGKSGDQNITSRSDYQNLRFTGGGIKTITSGMVPVGTVTIAGATILDISNNTFGSAATNLTMTDGRLRISGLGPKPDIDGAYILSGNSVIEFYNSGTIGNQTIKGKNGVSNDILYNQIEVTGNKVGNSNSNIILNSNGIFSVKTGGIFEMSNRVITPAPATSGQSMIIENNGTFLCGNTKGLNGFTPTFLDNSSIHSNITNIMLGTNSTVNYAREGDQPLTTTDNIIYGNLILSGSGVKSAPSHPLIVKGDLVKTGSSTFDANGGTVLLNGSAQSFAGLTYNNLLLDNAGIKTLSGNALILDSIRIGNPASDPATILDLGNYDLTLKSTGSGTAKVGIVSPAVTITYSGTGRFVVERFFKSLRAWRVITLPLSSKGTTNTSIFDTWQNAGVYEVGKGMFVTGPGASYPMPGVDGLDWSEQNNYSLKRFSHNSYIGMGKTKDSLLSGSLTDTSANIGYFAFIRGDRSRAPNNTVTPNTNVTTLTGRGKLQTGRQTFPVNIDSLNSFTLIGNPYPCPIDFNLITKNNVYPNRFIIYDPTVNGVGVFVVMEDGGSGIFAPIDKPASTQNNFIQSGQAFFVQPNNIAAPADLVFNESNKSVSNISISLFRPTGDVHKSFKTLLNKWYDDSTISLVDGVYVQLDDAYANAIDIEDVLKFGNVAENLGMMRNGRILAVEKRPPFTENDTLFYKLTRTTQRNYQFKFSTDMEAPGLVAYLEDSYTGIPEIVHLPGTTSTNFNINSDKASSDPGRFRIIFKKVANGTLSVIYSNIKAWQQDNNIAVEWTIKNEANTTKYNVEKSVDGINFMKVNTTIATGANLPQITYGWLDKNTTSGNNYYRICSYGRDGKIGYSRIVKVTINKVVSVINLCLNPITDHIICMEFKNMPAGKYLLKLINNLGQIIFQKMINHSTGTLIETVIPDHKLAAGIYQLEVMTPDKAPIMLKVIVQ